MNVLYNNLDSYCLLDIDIQSQFPKPSQPVNRNIQHHFMQDFNGLLVFIKFIKQLDKIKQNQSFNYTNIQKFRSMSRFPQKQRAISVQKSLEKAPFQKKMSAFHQKQDQFDIYSIQNESGSDKSSLEKQSSFQLESDNEPQQQDKQNLKKVLQRLGLHQKVATKNRNQQLEIVVNNFVQNCIGTVDRVANTQEYDRIYDQDYQEKAKNSTPYSSVYISELTQLEKLKKLSDDGLWGLIKNIRIFLKYITMACDKIVQHVLFQAFILIVILLNSLKMATDDPLATTTNLPAVQTAFTTIYTLQMGLKIFAYGFIFNKKAYLRDLWNFMDFVIVFTSLLPLVINIGFSVSALRAIRVLRPLRTITKVKALKMIVKTLFNSFSLVMDSLTILIFVMGVFAIAGMQLFSGDLKNACMDQATGAMTTTLCLSSSDCSAGGICVKGIASPNFSIMNFDTFLWSFLSVFQIISTEGWSQIAISIQKTKGFVYIIYSILIIFICLYILLNMTMAILKYKYGQVKQNVIEEEQEQKEEYELQFFKKLGILKDISVLSHPAPLAKINDKNKKQIGCSSTLPNQIKKVDLSVENLIAHLQAPKVTMKVQKQDQNKLNLKQLRQFGKFTDYKWDANNLQFQTNQEQKQLYFKKEQQKDDQQKIIGIKQEQQQQISEDSFSDEDDEDQQDFSQSSQQEEIADKVFQLQKKLNGSTIELAQIKLQKIEQKPQVGPSIAESKSIPAKSVRQISDFEKLLQLIGSKPGIMNTQAKRDFVLPEVDIKMVAIEKIYERFADLGEYKMPKIKKQNQLNTINVVKKNIKQKLMIKKQAGVIKQIVEQNTLDLKELHLKNTLQKMELRCRVKSDELIDAERVYDVTRVIQSKKVKQIQKKKNQIKQNLNTLHFNVKYKIGDSSKNMTQNSKFIRNLFNNQNILKIPQIVYVNERAKKNQKDTVKQNNEKEKHKDHYLRLLQNHSVDDKVQLSLDKVTNVFFRKEGEKKKKADSIQQKSSAIEQYQQLIQEDILKRHGHLQLQLPISTKQSTEFVSSMNMKPAEYEINIKGFFGLIRVFRKKILFIVSDPLYDNLMLVVVLLNTSLMSLNGYVQTDLPPYSYINKAFTFIFVADVVLKITAYGIKFFGDMMNLFDTAVVAVSLVELFIGEGGSNLSALRSIRILRAFRVLRITRLIRSLSYMRVIMGVVNSVISEFMYVFFLLWLFIFIYTLLGMQIFGGTFVSQNISGVRQNYDTFFNALFTIFQVLTGQNWNDIQTATALSSVGQWGIIFLVSWIFIGNWILLNLLQAVLLDGFDDDSTNPEEQIGQSHPEETDTAQVQDVQQEQQLLSKSQESEQSRPSTTRSITMDSDDASLYIFTPKNPVRIFCKALITSSIFEAFMLIVIISSSLKLAFDTYTDTGASDSILKFSQTADYVFTSIFLFQFLLKVIYMGFVIGENAYLKSSWNKLDFFIVLVSIIDLSLQGVNLSIIKLMRTLRALRIITRNQEMRIMVSSIVQSLLGIFNVLIICLCVFLMFAILGMSLLQGKLNFCNTGGSQLIYNNYGPYNISQNKCIAAGGVWTTQLVNFQNIGSAMMSLYIFATRENWPYYVFTFIDANDTGPTLNNNQILFFIFTVSFLFVGTYFFMDLLIGVMFMNYHESQAKIRPQMLSDKQINWKNLQKIIVTEDPCFQLYIAPTNEFLKILFKIISNSFFEGFISLVITVNIFIMALSNDDLHENTLENLSLLNSICSYIFIFELVLKLVIFGRAYFLSAWNIFDFVVVSASLLDIILHYVGTSSSAVSNLSFLPQIARIFRVLRITRLLRTFKSFKGLQKLIQTFVFSLPAISKGLAILSLYLFISSILASYLLGSIKSDYSGIFNNYLNYSTFHTAFQTLFINITGQNWYVFMFFSTTPGYAVCLDGTSSCINAYYYVFWFPYIFLAQKVFQELFVLIVLDQFENNYINQHNPLGVFALLQQDFRQNWFKVTEKYHFQKIQSRRLVDLLLLLRPPLGLGRDQTVLKYTDELEVNQKITKQEINKKVIELDQKLKRNAARLIHKMNILKNRIYFGYHQTFYHFARLSILPDCFENANNEQKQALFQMQKETQQILAKLKPEGALYYYEQLSNDLQNQNAPLNPISLILFTQIIIKSWHNYSNKIKQQSRSSENKKKKDLQDSMDKSCSSDVQQARYQKISNDRKIFTRRGGLIENKAQSHSNSCQFKQIPNMCSAYGEGKRMKHKISIMKKKSSILANRRSSQINHLISSLEKIDNQFYNFKS